MSEMWSWLAIAGLGAFHGLNPAMGWLFAVALGLHRGGAGGGRTVAVALLPIAIGHALAVAAAVIAFVLIGRWLDAVLMRKLSGLMLVGWACLLGLYGHHRRVRFGMRTGLLGLLVWSFLMATGHGAGLMLWPAVAPLCAAAGSAGNLLAGPMAIALAAVALHTAAMLAVTGIVALAVYRWIGLALLRSAWVNFDALWIAALLALGLLLLAL